MLFLVGFVLGVVCSSAAVFVVVLNKREKSCSGILAIDSDDDLFLELDEPVADVKQHKLIFLKVVSV